MTVAAVRPTRHISHANRWLIAAVIVLAAALIALGVYTFVHEEPVVVKPSTTTSAQTLDQGQMQALVVNRQDANNAYDAARLASFYAPNAVFYDAVTDTRLVGGPAIAEMLTDAAKQMGFAYRIDGGPYVVGDRYLVVPFSLVNPKNVAKRTGAAQRVNVLEIKDDKIVREWGYGMY
jgi:hypothetical protein